jgi:predicted acetyltransferase
MEFTYAMTENDLEEIAQMMGKIFRSKNWFEFYTQRSDYHKKSPYFKPEHSRIARENGCLLGHVSIIEKYIRIGNCSLKLAGIGDVYTHPDGRGKRVSSTLMNDAVDYMRKNKYPISMLYGIPNFYHKFGYIEAMASHSVFVPLKYTSKVEGNLELRQCRDSDIEILNRLYNNNFQDKTGSVRRVSTSWYNIAKPKELFVTTDKRDRPTGYLIFKSVWGGSFYVTEIVAPDEDIRNSILAFCCKKAKKSFVCELEFRITPDDSFCSFLKDFDARIVSQHYAEGQGSAMLRIINLPDLLKKIKSVLENRIVRSDFAKKKCGINIVTDDAGSASLYYDKGKITIKARPDKKLKTLECRQDYLTRSVMGYWDIERFKSRTEESGGSVHDSLMPLLDVIFPGSLLPFTGSADYF